MANTSRASRLHSLVPIPRLVIVVVVVVLRAVGCVEVVDACCFWWSPGLRVDVLRCWRCVGASHDVCGGGCCPLCGNIT